MLPVLQLARKCTSPRLLSVCPQNGLPHRTIGQTEPGRDAERQTLLPVNVVPSTRYRQTVVSIYPKGLIYFRFMSFFFSFRDEICFIKLLERENGLSPKMSALLVSSIYLQLRCSIHYKVNPCFCYRKSVTKD